MRTLMNLDLLREVDAWGRQFEQLLTEQPPCQRPEMGRVWQPAIELEETENSFVLRVEVPGLTGEEIDVQASRFQVAIAAQRQPPTPVSQNSGYLRSELNYGKLRRVVPLPKPIVPDRIEAQLNNGILTLTLPKFSAQQTQVVKVRLDELKSKVNPVMPVEQKPDLTPQKTEEKIAPSEGEVLTDLWATPG
ncbi:Hsp20/alpha crystallin family protein [Oscillatoria acuminata]|uniref:Molecular chaperone (Small heat shock protein) n=1 Tax=Oscillatoria acuminata PCC 6304 TaxID=56110 RepID=K9TSX1_9CYAN|nr:Hsp20/alpha crystallin family protein [Oscillatoria acuminata]AFY85256.1 molecular chaperone (small heat shock protein) [Oscillatoria acuminata PCC 6304]